MFPSTNPMIAVLNSYPSLPDLFWANTLGQDVVFSAIQHGPREYRGAKRADARWACGCAAGRL